MTDRQKPEHPLRVILDISSLKDKHSNLIQRYEDNDFFEFTAIGGTSKFSELTIDHQNEVLLQERDYGNKQVREEWAFPYPEEILTTLAAKRDVKFEEIQLLFAIRTIAADKERKAILVTERKKLLNYKKYFSEKLPDFTVFCPEDAKNFIDLFCKKCGAYLIKPHYFINRGLWYRYSAASKLQELQVPTLVNMHAQNPPDLRDKELQMLNSISNRVKDMLKAIDEIGMNYYKGSNNDTMDDMLYHFNYWITLYSGVLDVLAWISLYRYNIPVLNRNKVSLGNEEVLAELFKYNVHLQGTLRSNQKIIDLVYEPRNIFIHREMLQSLRLMDYQASLELNMLVVEGEFLSHIRNLQPVVLGGLNKAGLYMIKDHGVFYLEPYRFVKFATKEFFSFLNQYIAILDYGELLSQDPLLKQNVEDAAKPVPGNFYFDALGFQDTALGY